MFLRLGSFRIFSGRKVVKSCTFFVEKSHLRINLRRTVVKSSSYLGHKFSCFFRKLGLNRRKLGSFWVRFFGTGGGEK